MSITLLILWCISYAISPAYCFSVVSPSSSPPPIITCKSTAQVERAIDIYIQPNDIVLELGAQLSGTSAHLCRAIGSDGRAVLVDVKRKEASSGRSIGRDTSLFLDNTSDSFADRVDYQELEQFDMWRGLLSQQYDVMILDVGSTIGNDLYLSALTIANEFVAHQQNRPRAIIIKSKSLSNLSRRLIHSQRLLDGTIKLPTKKELEGYPDPLLIPCVGVSNYRETIPLVVENGDDVLEVGCHYGTTTALLHEAAVTHDNTGFCAGVDIGQKIIQNAKRRYPYMLFEVVDAWNTLDLLKVKIKHSGGESDFHQ